MTDYFARSGAAILTKAARALASQLFVPAASWTLMVFSGATVLMAVLQRHLLEETQTAQHLVEFNVGEIFGIAAIMSLLPASSRTRVTLAGSDVAVLLVSALAWFIPEQHGVYLATTLAGVWLLSRGRSYPQLFGVAQVWLALSVYELWGKLLFKLAYQTIEVFEVSLIYKVGRLFYSGLGVTGVSLSVRSDWSIVILEGCSSFHNLSLTVLIWLSILKIGEQAASAAAFSILGVSACLVVAINLIRILAMLPSRDAFVFWHDGGGSVLVALSSVFAAVLPILLYVDRQTCRPSAQT